MRAVSLSFILNLLLWSLVGVVLSLPVTKKLTTKVVDTAVRSLTVTLSIPTASAVKRKSQKTRLKKTLKATKKTRLNNTQKIIKKSLSYKLHTPYPAYPEKALRLGLAGEILIQVSSGEAGEIIKAKIIQSSGHRILDDAALIAVKKWTIKPLSDAKIPIIFNLDT